MTYNNSNSSSPFQSVWFWVVGILLCFLGGLAFALWSSYDNRFEQNAEVIEQVQQEALAIEQPEVAAQSKNDTSIDPSLPVPAKKLQTLLTEQSTADDDLDARMAALDKQLKALDEQLKAQGIDIPTSDAADATAASSLDETEARLTAIKDFMTKKEQDAQTLSIPTE